jgi:predicted metalloprotease
MRTLVLLLCFTAFGRAEAGVLDVCQRLLRGVTPNFVSKYFDTDANNAAAVWGSVERFWEQRFKEKGLKFTPSVLVLYSKSVTNPCGIGTAGMGPFYCPLDQKTYIDLEFWNRLANHYKATGEAIPLYVLSHEYGHHILNILGVMPKIFELQKQFYGVPKFQIQVMHELMADAMAGFYVREMARRNVIDDTDLCDLRKTCRIIGDDNLATMRGRPAPYTHGTSKQREAWFLKGFHSRNVSDFNPFVDSELIAIFKPNDQQAIRQRLSLLPQM